jgi:phage shock protein E
MFPRRYGFVTLVTLTAYAGLASAAELTNEPLSTVKENVQSGKAVLVDVREKKEWDAGHIEGAILMPFSSVKDGLSNDELKQLPKDKILYVHCVVGKRAVAAANVFEKNGFEVRPIKPGYKELVAAGFPKAKD